MTNICYLANNMFYSVHKGLNSGIFKNWEECKKNVIGVKGSVFKKFKNLLDAEYFLKNGEIRETISSEIVKVYTDGSSSEIVKVYTDGACFKNGLLESRAGIGIYFEENDKRNVSERIYGKQTNNTAELKAIIKACNILMHQIKNGKNIEIFSDSEYSINCATIYGEKQNKINWCKNIPNKELVKEIYIICSSNKNIKIKHVKAHTNKKDENSIGNKMADKLAVLSLVNK